MTDAKANMSRYKGYFESLQRAYTNQFESVRNLIDKDIRRTYAKHITLKQKESLFKVLFSYAKRNGEIGYCQGMNVLAYFFITMGFNEEESFWILTYVIENLIPHGYYTNMVAVISDISLLKHLFTVILPLLVSHFRKNMIDINHFLLPWFLMAFSNMENTQVSSKVKNGHI